MTTTASELEPARDLLAFIDASPTPYHAVRETSRRLALSGYTELDEREEWRLEPGSRAYVVRSGGAIAAFALGTKPPAESGFVIIGAHTDSPNLRLKPHYELQSSGYGQLAVEVYGGVLLHTWLDRDLTISGRLSLRGGGSALVRARRPLCRIPNLAIHLQRELSTQGLSLNAQTHTAPLWSLNEGNDSAALLRVLADGASDDSDAFDPAEVLGFDLCLHDAVAGVLAGPQEEFIYSARLDNLASCHAALTALLGGAPTEASRVVVLYDHEEVGSQSTAGARSRFFLSLLERLVEASSRGGSSQSASRAIARSLLISADMAHAVHPNYADKHDKQHQPKLGHGPVIKVNVNQSYATDGPSAALFREACEQAGTAAQYFSSRNDMPCGSTIGPIAAARIGLRAVDVGNPMLSMHSCREMAASRDVGTMIRVLTRALAHPDLPRSAV